MKRTLQSSVALLTLVGALGLCAPSASAAVATETGGTPARTFSVPDKPAQGAKSAAGAQELAAGQYNDTIGADQDQRFYKVKKSAGSTVHVTVAARPNIPLDSASSIDGFTVSLKTPDGAGCGDSHESFFSNVVEVLTVSVRQKSPQAAPPCDVAPTLLLTVTRGSDSSAGSAPKTGSTPFALAVLEEPAVTNFDALEPRVEDATQVRAAAPEASEGGTAVAGGGSFFTAATLVPGTNYADVLHGGEAVFYRVRADEGRAPALTATIAPSGSDGYTTVSMRAFAPDWAPVRVIENAASSIGKNANYNFTTAAVLRSALPRVRYRNRENAATDVSPVSIDGFYYFEIVALKSGKEWQAPLRISVALTGEQASVAPQYVKSKTADLALASSESAESSKDSDGPSTTLLAVGAVLLFLGGFSLIFLLTRKKPGVRTI